MKQFALSLILLCSCGSPFSGIDDGTVEGGDDAAPDVAPDAPAPSEAATDVLPPDVDPQDADAGMATDAPPDVPSEACVSGLWCAIEDGGSFTPCGAGNFTCGGNACDPMHCTEGGPCRILTGMGPDGSIYEDGKVTRCAP